MAKLLRQSKALRYSIIFVGVMLIIELLLRGVGVFLILPTEVRNEIYKEDQNKIRILAVGESTTSDHYSKDDPNGAWPRQLEARLRASGIDARVYNEGITGTESAYIVSRMRDYLELYRPHIVISMMGVNDGVSGIRFNESLYSTLALAAQHIRVVKMGVWMMDWLDSEMSCKFDYEKITDADYLLAQEATQLALKAQTPPLEKVEKYIRTRTQDRKGVAHALMAVARNLVAQKVAWTDVSAFAPFVDRAFELYPYNLWIAFETLSFRNDKDWASYLTRERFMEVSDKILLCGRNVPDLVLRTIAMHSKGPNPNFGKAIAKLRGFSHLEVRTSFLHYHYRLLHSILRDNGVKHIAMQYPTRPLSDLKNIFIDSSGQIENEFSNLRFVSNENNFKKALEENSYDAIFLDHFRGSWGHATKLGNGLIAHAALGVATELIEAK